MLTLFFCSSSETVWSPLSVVEKILWLRKTHLLALRQRLLQFLPVRLPLHSSLKETVNLEMSRLHDHVLLTYITIGVGNVPVTIHLARWMPDFFAMVNKLANILVSDLCNSAQVHCHEFMNLSHIILQINSLVWCSINLFATMHFNWITLVCV